MPDDRLFHKRAGHSEKVNKLSDFEELVWRYYVESADDFGVMRFTPMQIQADHDRMAKRTPQVIQRALEHARALDLIRTFDHQGRTYCYSPNWQEHQRIRYPQRTMHPAPPAGDLAACELSTQWLFSVHPGGNRTSKLASWAPPPDWNGSGTVPNPHARALPLAVSHKPLAVSPEPAPAAPRATLEQPIVDMRSHRSHAYCGRPCVPDFLHRQLVDQLGAAVTDPDGTVRQFYRDRSARLAEDAVIANPVKFWEIEFAAFVREKFPTAVGVPASGPRPVTTRSHTPADVDKYAGLTRGLDAGE